MTRWNSKTRIGWAGWGMHRLSNARLSDVDRLFGFQVISEKAASEKIGGPSVTQI
jgi:hypothetical protein